MRAGGGKKHGHYWLANNLVDTASMLTLSQLRVRTTDSTPQYAHGLRLQWPACVQSRLFLLHFPFVAFSYLLFADGGTSGYLPAK